MGQAATFRHARLNVTTAGTPQQLPEVSVRSIIVQAVPGNTGSIAVGGDNTTKATVGSTQRGIILAAGASVALAVDDTSDIWIDATVSGEGVHYAYTAA